MLVIVSIDTLLFVTASFHGQDNYEQVLVSALIGKSAVAIIYSVMLTAYLLLTRRIGQKVNDLEEPVRDICTS